MRQRITLGLLPLACSGFLGLSLTMFAPGCGQSDSAPPSAESSGKPESFNDQTNPLDLIKLVNNAPQTQADAMVPRSDLGKTISVKQDSLPFSGTYWPMQDNGILARWSGDLSPAEKYGTLFLDRNQQQEMYSWIQQNHGRGVPNVESWFGICQGWTASAIMEKAPLHEVTVRKVVDASGKVTVEPCNSTGRGCVTFEPGDLLGLLAEAYADADARFVGYRCDTETAEFNYDNSGRIRQPNCRSNAGTLFLLATNFIKQNNRAFAINAENGEEVWNQPAFAYQIQRYDTVSAAQVAQLVDPRQRSYIWNPSAVGFRRVRMNLVWAAESQPTFDEPPTVRDGRTYDFVLELDAGGIVIGGEWIGNSKRDHPPFFWAPVGPKTEVPHLDYDNVKALLAAARM